MEKIMNEFYTQGFIDKCAEVGVDPEWLLKAAQAAGWRRFKSQLGGMGRTLLNQGKMYANRAVGSAAGMVGRGLTGAINAGNAVNQGALAARGAINQGVGAASNAAQNAYNAAGTAINQGATAARETGQGIAATGQEIAGGVRNIGNVLSGAYRQGAQNVQNQRGIPR
jgi:hypothetical protein